MADSVHEDILTLAVTRLASLDLGGVEDRIEEREILTKGWATAIAVFPLLVVSGVGLHSDIGGDNCSDEDEYPLAIRLIYRTQKWSKEERTAQQARIQTILDAFRHQPLTLTYSGAQCTDIVLQPSPTVEEEPLAWDLLSRALFFGVRTETIRP